MARDFLFAANDSAEMTPWQRQEVLIRMVRPGSILFFIFSDKSSNTSGEYPPTPAASCRLRITRDSNCPFVSSKIR